MEYIYQVSLNLCVSHKKVGVCVLNTATFYDPSDGRIIGTMACSEPAFDLNTENKNWIEGIFDFKTHYISNGVSVPRPTMPLTVTGSVITGIPQGATVTLGEQSFTVDDGEADIEGYTGIVKITCWPYLDAEVTL